MNFQPKKLKYDKNGVPYLRATEIEAIAYELLQTHCPEVLSTPKPTPVLDILERLKERTNLQYGFADLGLKGTAKILGKVRVSTGTLLLDNSLTTPERERQFRFTAAHEIGHWVLHRHRPIKFTDDSKVPDDDEAFIDNEDSLCRLECTSARDWVEYQANVFAASLVMPRFTLVEAVVRVQQEIGITKNFGLIFTTPHTAWDYVQTITGLAHRFQVSKESVEVRVRTLNVVIREAKKAGTTMETLLRSWVPAD
jgi:Zn-dependent peptidase ImmA (M78 family)